ncbi:solute carrier family 25 member 35-like [Thraustotheca clavata]|uniref:Solute carrier family 25 member 35-like n=1 Tax=Thraustotheca clavata TaxID=74557 RepID=A0A1V9ZW83_9STRA|nr:solute carrier family 25 member 35-like [Thraustotheca clavata]
MRNVWLIVKVLKASYSVNSVQLHIIHISMSIQVLLMDTKWSGGYTEAEMQALAFRRRMKEDAANSSSKSSNKKKKKKHKHKKEAKLDEFGRDRPSRNRDRSNSMSSVSSIESLPPEDPFRPDLDENRHKSGDFKRSSSRSRRSSSRNRSRNRRQRSRSDSRSRRRSRSRSRDRHSHRRKSRVDVAKVDWTHDAYFNRSPSPVRQVDPFYKPEPEDTVKLQESFGYERCESPARRSLYVSCALGGIASSLATIGSNPMEVVKTRMQLQGELMERSASYRPPYRNFFHAFYKIARSEGVVGIQRGLEAGMVYNVLMNGIRLGSFDVFQQFLGATDPNEAFYIPKNALAGALSGALGGIVGSPFYLIKTRLQAQSSTTVLNAQYNYSSMMDGFRQVFAKSGITGLYQGADGQMARLVVGSSAQLSAYSSAKHFVQTTLDLEPTSPWVSLGASLISGLAISTFMHPFDVVATRLASQKVSRHGHGALYTGVSDCFRKVLMTEGLQGLYKGWLAGYLRAGPHTMLQFVIWEKFKDIASSVGY